MHLNPFAIAGLVIASTNFPLFLFILTKGKTKISRIYSLHVFSIFVWGICAFIFGTTTDRHLADIFMRIAYCGVLFIPIFFQHAISLLENKKSNTFITIIYIYATALALLNLRGDLPANPRIVFESFYYYSNNIYFVWIFVIWLLIVFNSYMQLVNYYSSYHPKEKTTIKILLLSMIGFLGGLNNFLLAFDIYIYPYGNFLIPVHSFFVTYAILKHRFLDIGIAIKKSVIYSILIAIVSIFYLLIIFVLEKFAQQIFGYRSFIISISTAFGLGLIFIPLRHRIQYFIDRYFFKGTQEEIAQQNVQLRQEIAQSEKYKTLSTLASGIAHEIKNPLTAMKTFCEYLPRRLDDREFLLKFSRLVGKEVERIDGMVHELLDYSKPGPLTLKRTDINKLIEDTLSTLSNQFIKHHIEVAQHLSPDNYHLIIDANRVKQVLLNLFLNAIEAMPTGGQLTVTSLVSRISSLETFVITITDTGSGIAPEDLKHIFDPFFSRKDHGTGLGLAIVQGIMEQHRGKVRITSQVGVGTEVRLEFPITA